MDFFGEIVRVLAGDLVLSRGGGEAGHDDWALMRRCWSSGGFCCGPLSFCGREPDDFSSSCSMTAA